MALYKRRSLLQGSLGCRGRRCLVARPLHCQRSPP